MRLKQYIIEQNNYRFVVETSNGFNRYDEIMDNKLYIENDAIHRYHKNKNLMTVVYLYDGDELIGFTLVNYDSEQIPRDAHKYGVIPMGQVGVFVSPKYRNNKLGQQLLTKLKENLVSKKSPQYKYIKKHKIGFPTYQLTMNKRLESLAKRVFNDTDDGDPIYTFKWN
jgi:GNAT superfamily N-acetyltransferase